MQRKWTRNLWTAAGILAGNTLYALAVTMFILPNGLITGGTTGLALLFYHQFGMPVSGFVMAFNAAMFLLGALVLGRKFALTTLLSTFYYPAALELLRRFDGLSGFTGDRMLATLFAGLMIGAAIGLVIKCGASTGGMDIPPLVLRKKAGIPVPVSMYAFDFLILLAQMLFADRELVLYGILLVLLYTVVLDRVLLSGGSKTEVKIISRRHEAIREWVLRDLDRGATLLHASGGYESREMEVVLTVVSNRELPRLNRMVLDLDPDAFMIVNQANEVKGRGFTLEKVYR